MNTSASTFELITTTTVKWHDDEQHLQMHFDRSPISCAKLKTIGMATIFLFGSSIMANSTLLWMFYSYKHLKASLNMFVIALTVLNLIGTTLQLPFIIVSNLMCRWPFRQIGCTISAFIMFFVGCTSMYLMAVIAVERFWLIRRPALISRMRVTTRLQVIAGCATLALVWSLMPLIGWSRYSMEPSRTSCAVEWAERSLSVTSFNVTLFFLVFFVPLVLIVVFNTRLIIHSHQFYSRKIKIMRSSGKDNANVNSSHNDTSMVARSSNNDIDDLTLKSFKLTVILIIYIFAFIIAWTPYALVAFYSALIEPNGVPPIYSLLPALFAKSSMFWSSLFYLCTNYMFNREKNTPSARVPPPKVKYVQGADEPHNRPLVANKNAQQVIQKSTDNI